MAKTTKIDHSACEARIAELEAQLQRQDEEDDRLDEQAQLEDEFDDFCYQLLFSEEEKILNKVAAFRKKMEEEVFLLTQELRRIAVDDEQFASIAPDVRNRIANRIHLDVDHLLCSDEE